MFLFGLVLTLRRTIDQGSLWGCIGLHGGLVGIWYLFDSGMVVFSIDTPYFLLGPSKNMVNPIGSVVGITILLVTLFFQRRLFSMGSYPFEKGLLRGVLAFLRPS